MAEPRHTQPVLLAGLMIPVASLRWQLSVEAALHRLIEGWPMVIAVLRHGQSDKNVQSRHGEVLGGLTSAGKQQMAVAAKALLTHRTSLTRVRYASTSQCAESARIVAELLSITDIDSIGLKPYGLGSSNGRSEIEFEREHPDAAKRLERFRLGLIDAKDLALPGGESIENLDQRVRQWWSVNKSSVDGTIFVLSRSLILMVHAALTNQFPLTSPMYDWALPPGGLRLWERYEGTWITNNLSLRALSWPHTDTKRISSNQLTTILTKFSPGYFHRRPTLIIVPGLFGNSRQGPYNLYSRIAFATAGSGLTTVTYDPPGSGDSIPLPRTFEDDFSALRLVSEECDNKPILLTHSAGIAVAQAAIADGLEAEACIAIAPVTNRNQILRAIRDPNDLATLEDPIAVRTGVNYRPSYIDDVAAIRWPARVDHLILAEQDQYVSKKEATSSVISEKVRHIEGADHAFSNDQSGQKLIEVIVEILIDMARHDTNGSD